MLRIYEFKKQKIEGVLWKGNYLRLKSTKGAKTPYKSTSTTTTFLLRYNYRQLFYRNTLRLED
jgi:hypothetical protein